MRYAFLKTNHCVSELERVCAQPDLLLDGGPDAYVAHFVRIVNGNPGLLLSVHFQPEQDSFTERCNIRAYSFYWYSRFLKPLGRIAESPVGTLVRRLTVSLRMYRMLVCFRPTHLLCWAHSFPLWAAFLAARSCGAHFIYSRHNRLLGHREPFYLRITNAVDRWIMRHADAVIVHGPYLRDQMQAVGVAPAKLVEFSWGFRHLLDQAETANAQSDGAAGEIKSVLYIGRVEETKGVFDLLEACTPRLRKSHDTKLVYAGDGTELDRLRRRVGELRLGNKVRLLGMVPHKELAALIRASTVVVTPTQTAFPEGRCMATIEGLIMGKPVVAPNWGPFRYLVEHERNGLLYKPDSIEDLRQAIHRVLDDAELRQRLASGARLTGQKLCTAEVSYSKALGTAFAIAGMQTPRTAAL